MRDTKTGTEHLLLASLAERDTLVSQLIRGLGTDPERIRRALGATPAGSAEYWPYRAPARLPETRRGEVLRMWQRFTERARRVVFFAQEEAARLGENYVGTEHLLLGLVRESDSVAACILDQLGIPLGRVRADVERQITRGHGSLGQDMQLTPRGKRVIDLAYEEARQLNHKYIGTEHLLLGLISEGDGLAARVLSKLGAELDVARREVSAMQEGEGLRASDSANAGAETREQNLDRLRWLADDLRADDLHPTRNIVSAVNRAKAICSGVEDFLSIAELNAQQLEALLLLARILKFTTAHQWIGEHDLLQGKVLALIFEKPSLRTRVTFETGAFQLGARAIHLGPTEIGLGTRETAADAARNLERWVQGIVARTFSHQTLHELAQHSRVPVINALSDLEHPCQALADFMTLQERCANLSLIKLVYVGDGNNMAHSLIHAAARLGTHLCLACPDGYQPDEAVLEAARAEAERSGARIEVVRDPKEAAVGADAVYTDVWASMGQEAEADARAEVFQPYQLNSQLLALAKPEAVVMHCLPAHRDQEITDEVIDGPQSVVFDQAENRLHVQKALMAVLLS